MTLSNVSFASQAHITLKDLLLACMVGKYRSHKNNNNVPGNDSFP